MQAASYLREPHNHNHKPDAMHLFFPFPHRVKAAIQPSVKPQGAQPRPADLHGWPLTN